MDTDVQNGRILRRTATGIVKRAILVEVELGEVVRNVLMKSVDLLFRLQCLKLVIFTAIEVEEALTLFQGQALFLGQRR